MAALMRETGLAVTDCCPNDTTGKTPAVFPNVSSLPRKNKCLCENQKQTYISAIPRSLRRACRDRHDTLRGERWTLSVPQASETGAYGEVAWSWSPDAGIKPRVEHSGRRRLTSPVLRREREVSRKAIAQGVPCDFGPA
jgi:hypothetical protein